ncbi:F-box only protein 6 [Nasonia vitripennis]|uniref:Uncharacterized protein n=1 Tax=Nasonia vitripennis TaxID=7425 RepID=A0A7M7H6Q5_NASVI|nr:F-box only protein 6 [Nasonia vitripennis]XP_008206758.1 F-box only protein 6 [Nasonia vitripennis]XP_008208937.1 F-box only protein 6 [Nasonia vitripennis]XP_008209463.1 F-box only protein 6 [Nasonia vitripennis]XP_032458177.1 F-box only protein 6 [Nasonia vitripennis]XP_032458178.1 F-box only protein 6 [Nasonia vitripennis]XP_032458179.1 F-box only protein 6 [Nasonia vitripennis]XP_032458180.1 F-box only protein 6 [Nasonia vitripennis]
MGQISDKLKSMAVSEERVAYDEASNNGLIIRENYIPEELLCEILCYVDHKTLCNCQLVCKQWLELIQGYVWRKKAERTLGKTLPVDENAPWTMYYFICDKKAFGRNLIKNHSGKTRVNSDWTIVNDGGDGWKVENPPVGVPALPDDPVFEGKQCCFVTSYDRCCKQQTIDLLDEGFTEYLLDNLQPTIKVSEWYSSRWDCPALYVCTVELLQKGEGLSDVIQSYNFSKILEGEEQNQWFKFEHEFKNYGPGLRKISFSHGGQDRSFWSGYYGSKMAGACVKLEIPDFHHNDDSEKVDIDKQD